MFCSYNGSFYNESLFTIDPLNGSLYTRMLLDRETKDVHELTVHVYSGGSSITNGGGGGTVPPRSHSAIVVIVVDDVNDNAPVFNFPSMTHHTVHVTMTTTQNAGDYTVVAQVHANDADVGLNARLTYSIQVKGFKR